MTVSYRLGGTARNGVDYATLPGTIDVPAKKEGAMLVIRPLVDGIVEGPETIEIEVLPGDDYAPAIPSSVTIALVGGEKPPKIKKRR